MNCIKYVKEQFCDNQAEIIKYISDPEKIQILEKFVTNKEVIQLIYGKILSSQPALNFDRIAEQKGHQLDQLVKSNAGQESFLNPSISKIAYQSPARNARQYKRP